MCNIADCATAILRTAREKLWDKFAYNSALTDLLQHDDIDKFVDTYEHFNVESLCKINLQRNKYVNK